MECFELVPPLLQLGALLRCMEQTHLQMHHRITHARLLLVVQDEVHAGLFSKASPHFSARGSPSKAVPGNRYWVHARVASLITLYAWGRLRGVIISSIKAETRWHATFLSVLPARSTPLGQPLGREILDARPPALLCVTPHERSSLVPQPHLEEARQRLETRRHLVRPFG